MKKRYHLFFSGQVQGIGFRYTARSLAEKYGIYGWIANLSDGRVELDIEGKAYELNNFLDELKREFKTYLGSFESEELPYSGAYKDFQIKLY